MIAAISSDNMTDEQWKEYLGEELKKAVTEERYEDAGKFKQRLNNLELIIKFRVQE